MSILTLETKKYAIKTDSFEGPWEHRVFDFYYHDCSLLFDDARISNA